MMLDNDDEAEWDRARSVRLKKKEVKKAALKFTPEEVRFRVSAVTRAFLANS
jgi:hypothetical protein